MSVERSRPLTGLAGVVGGYAALDSGLLVPVANIPLSKLPGYEFDYVEITSNVSVTGDEATPTTVVTGNSVTLDGGAVLVEFFSPSCIPQATASATLKFYVFIDGTAYSRIAELLTPSATSERVPVTGKRRITGLSAGSHQVVIKASTSSGTATVGAGPGDADKTHYMPAFLRVTKV